MGKISPSRRKFEIRKKQKRRRKIRKLKEEFLKAKTEKERGKILEKIKKIAPHYPLEEILKLKGEE